MKKLNFLVSYPYNRITDKLIGYLVETGHQVDMVDSPDTPRWLDKYYYNLTVIPPNKIHSKQYDFQLDTEKPQSFDLPLLHIDAKKLVNNGIQCAVKLHLQKNVFTIFSKKIIYQKDFSEIYSEIKELFIDAIVYLAREAEKLKLVSLDPCDCDSFLEIFQMEEGISKLNAFYEANEKSDSEKFILRNLLINSSFSQSKKSLALNKITLSVTQVEFITLFLTTLLNARRQSNVHYNIIHNKKTIAKYIDICPSMTFETILKNLQNPIYDVKNSRFFNHYIDSKNPAEILLQIEENEENNIILQNDYLLIIRYNILSGELTLIYQEQLYFFDQAQQYIHYFLKNFESWKEKKEPLQAILYTETHLYHQQLYEWNSNFSEEIEDRTVHELFEEQASRTPDNIAVVYKNVKLSYADLNKKANQLAHYLKENHAIKPDDIIALYLGRSEYMIIAILGVLKAGGAYVPIDISSSDEKIRQILKDTKTKIILTTRKLYNHVKSIIKEKELLLIDSLKKSNKTTSCPNSAKRDNLAYVLYTSGTTGNSKGVMIEHKSLTNFSIYHKNFLRKSDKILGYIHYTFDAINTEIFPCLLCGCPLYLVSESLRINLNELIEYITKCEITVAVLPAIIASEITSNPKIESTSLRVIITGGDVYWGKLNNPKITIINAFGPTETTTCATLHTYKNPDLRTNIGKPITNTQCYVLDKNLDLLPAGVIGELHIGGDGLARGYLNKKSLTESKFIENPFIAQKEYLNKEIKKLYKTGDLVRYLSNGEIEYIGRNDTQVKFLGYAISLEEIQNKISSYGQIKQSAVTIYENNSNKYLIAYYTADIAINESLLIKYLTNQLPKYMVPVKFIKLDSIPLTKNGKLNKDRIPTHDFSDTIDASPENESEKLICSVFSEILKKNVKINDNFFKLGGDSIAAIRLTLKLQNYFDIKVNQIFNFPTPKSLSKKIKKNKQGLIFKLQSIKQLHYDSQKPNDQIKINQKIRESSYLTKILEIKFDPEKKKKIFNVLLTGSTGYLGCNLLYQLLFFTQYKIFLLVRGKSREMAFKRLSEKFFYYFKIDLQNYKNRFAIYISDLESENLNLTEKNYKLLAKKIDSIIHAAALVKHYGEYKKFHSANVRATTNLLEFTLLTKHKEFHYISTTAPLTKGTITNNLDELCTESDIFYTSPAANIYDQTKFEAEKIVSKYRKYGVKSNIYRVGNLVFMQNGCLQQNIDDNAFYNWLISLLEIKYIAKEISIVDLSPADLVAKAIVLLFDKEELSNMVFHVFNPHRFDLTHLALNNSPLFHTATIEEFIDYAIRLVDLGNCEKIERFLLHQGWLEDSCSIRTNFSQVKQDRTSFFLKKCGFVWNPIESKFFIQYVKTIISKNESHNGQ